MMTTLDAFFIFSKFWIFGLLVRVKGKGQKMAQNDKKKEEKSHSVSQELYLILLWFLVHMCRR